MSTHDRRMLAEQLKRDLATVRSKPGRVMPAIAPTPPAVTTARAQPMSTSKRVREPDGVESIRWIGFTDDLVRAIERGGKTETRRPVRPQPVRKPRAEDCPLARLGDVLGVREKWARLPAGAYAHAATGERLPRGSRWQAGRFMPRDALRLRLRVTSVRAERLHALTEAAARAEGFPADLQIEPVEWFRGLWDSIYGSDDTLAWRANPWVWVIGFDRVAYTASIKGC
ncbi:MAG: hypothetical protein QM770_04025 [Tepidisphaeraceae bacterium]